MILKTSQNTLIIKDFGSGKRIGTLEHVCFHIELKNVSKSEVVDLDTGFKKIAIFWLCDFVYVICKNEKKIVIIKGFLCGKENITCQYVYFTNDI